MESTYLVNNATGKSIWAVKGVEPAFNGFPVLKLFLNGKQVASKGVEEVTSEVI